jgi:hypothetical protein
MFLPKEFSPGNNKEMYTQCKLVLTLEDGSKLIDMAWIPAAKAKKGAIVALLLKGEWSNGLVIEEKFSTLPENAIYTRDYLHQRDVSDI